MRLGAQRDRAGADPWGKDCRFRRSRRIRYADISETGLYVEQEKTHARVLIAMTPDLADAIVRDRRWQRGQ